MADNKLELKITKDAKSNDIDLTSMSLEATKAFVVLLNSLTKIVELTPDNKNTEIKIIKGSAAAIATGDSIATIENDFNKVLSNSSTESEIVKSWKDIQELVKSNGLVYEINFIDTNSKKVTSVVDKIKKAKTIRTKKRTKTYEYDIEFLSGQLYEVGGVRPNIHIRINGQKYTIECSESTAKIANAYLYEQIYISAWMKRSRNAKTKYYLCEVYSQNHIDLYKDFKRFIDKLYVNRDDIEVLTAIHEKAKIFLDNKDFKTLIRFIRLFMHESTDVNILKTLLVITKAFKNHDDFKTFRNKLLELMNSKLATIE